MSTKKINVGDTLTVGDLTRAYIGAEIEVGTLVNITHRFTLGGFNDDRHSQKELWTSKVRVGSFYPNAPVTIITPPPVVQPDEPTILGQCIRIKGLPEWWGVVLKPEVADRLTIRARTPSGAWSWASWEDVLADAGDRQIIVSDPPRWPDENSVAPLAPDATEVPERIEVCEWPDDDTHLRGWEWHSVDDRFGNDHTARWNDQESQWECLLCDTAWRRGGQRRYAWTRGERVE